MTISGDPARIGVHPITGSNGNGLNSLADPHLICKKDSALPFQGKLHTSFLKGHQGMPQVTWHAGKALFCFSISGAPAVAPETQKTLGQTMASTSD